MRRFMLSAAARLLRPVVVEIQRREREAWEDFKFRNILQNETVRQVLERRAGEARKDVPIKERGGGCVSEKGELASCP